MFRDDFGYAGNNPAAKELVETINGMAKLLNGLQFDMGPSGGTDVVKIAQRGDRTVIDMSQVYIPPVPTSP